MASAIVASPVDAHKQISQSVTQFPTVTVSSSLPGLTVLHYPIPGDSTRECVILEHREPFHPTLATGVRRLSGKTSAKARRVPMLLSHDGTVYSSSVFAPLGSQVEVSR